MRILDERVWRGRRRTPRCACPRPPRPSTTVLGYSSRWPVTVWYLIGKCQVGADGRECHRLGDRCMRVRRLPRFGARVHACVDLFGAPIFTELDRPIAAEIGKVLRTFKLCSDGFRCLGSQSWRLNACLEVDLNNTLNVSLCVFLLSSDVSFPCHLAMCRHLRGPVLLLERHGISHLHESLPAKQGSHQSTMVPLLRQEFGVFERIIQHRQSARSVPIISVSATFKSR